VTAQRLAGQLIRLASRRLPEPDRAVRCREWTAEVAAILDDPGSGRVRRKITAVLFAADLIRSTRRTARRAAFPVAGWRAELPGLVPWGAQAAVFFVRWLPLAYPVRLALFFLLVAAVMVVQIIRERRHWRTGSIEEFDSARVRRRGIVVMWWSAWWVTLWVQVFDRGYGWWYLLVFLAGSSLVVPMLRRLDRWIFPRPALPGDGGERDSASPGATPAG
jgi:hypothetical protein